MGTRSGHGLSQTGISPAECVGHWEVLGAHSEARWEGRANPVGGPMAVHTLPLAPPRADPLCISLDCWVAHWVGPWEIFRDPLGGP